jgi:hypothetical protein
VILRGFTAVGSGQHGAVRLVGAHIGGKLECDGARLGNDSGPALIADNLHVDQSVHLRNEFTATGSGKDGAVNLVGAHIGGQLVCTKAELRNDSGPALTADSLQVDRNMDLSLLTATGASDPGAVHLTGAHISGQLNCTGAKLHNDSGPALSAESLQVDQNMFLSKEFRAIGGGAGVAVDLRGVQVGGALEFHPGLLKHVAERHRRLMVDGLTYTGVPTPISARDWLNLLRNGTPSYAAQPYQWLAAGYRAMGDEVIQQLSVGLDLNLPVGTSLARAKCDLAKNSNSATATWLTITGWVMGVLAWAFAALFIAGFTSAVRKT